jgi:hypothetical protein
MFYWFEPVLCLDPVSKFPETTERSGYFIEFIDNVGDELSFKIFKNDLVTVLHISVVRLVADASHRNKRVSSKSDIQESLKILYTKPSFIYEHSNHNYIFRKTNHDVANRIMSKAEGRLHRPSGWQ